MPPEKTLTGVISVTRRGGGYVAAEGFPEDIEIAPENIGGAFHKDKVEITLLKKEPNFRQGGKVERVLERAKTLFVGEVFEENGKLLLRNDDRRVYVPFLLGTKDQNPELVNALGKKVLVAMPGWNQGDQYPSATIKEVIGVAGQHETEMRAFVLSKGFELGFPHDVEAEAEEISKARDTLFKNALEEVTKGERKDFREVTTFTIDPADAKDFDDALSYRDLGDGKYEVGIHIADVTFYLKPGGAIDEEARKRATSIYLVDRTIPMLPEVLSNELCSLMPNVDRLAMAAVFVLDQNGVVHDRWFGRTLIHSGTRFTYEEAQESLTNPEGHLHKELSTLNAVAKKMRAQRAEEGAISFEQDEVKFKLDASGKPIGVYKKKRQDSNMLIEDYMLLANREVATHVTKIIEEKMKHGSSHELFVYRIHDAPDPERIESLAAFVHALGYKLDNDNGVVSAQAIVKLLKSVDGKPEADLVRTVAVRSLAKAIYSTENIGHFGLAFTHYTHFTSPIRRYPDVMVHRLLESYCHNQKLSERELQAYERLVVNSTEREIAAAEAERDSIKYKQVEYLSQFIGKEFDVVISGVADWGVYVEELESKAEGLVRMRDLGNDYFVLDKEKYRVVGERTKKVFQLGDKARVKLVSANLEERTLDFVFLKS